MISGPAITEPGCALGAKTAPIMVQKFSQKKHSIPPKIQKTKDREKFCLVDLWFLR
jgi:hypothetical protein